ncbi:hypothetical protein LOTGIDRAFT_126557 [Lottia gigantea]|uniref:Coiled-coil domain-containing protein n=1 Tax=Lottia gigantea TaxID=225164 RepID=V3ZZL8_LOTGI|nr:hypothetical protein LOTGIDRAFT_126557 [Lottia gigantea]ESO88115.1 hypothetical protein LOTGIDRAFT_126557 [Lottia gigantea]
MPKKFSGTNTKAAEAKARKSAQKEADNERKAAAAEDALWQDDDKQSNRKLQRKEDKEKKRLQQLEKKKELQQLHDEEMTKLKTAKPPPQPKITRGEIAATMEKQAEEKKSKARYNDDDDDLPPLEENLNRVVIEGEARTVDEAIGILGEGKEDVDMHPEKRMKAAFKKFEDSRLPALKRENPNLRLAQVKHMLQKEWMKSPENPLVQKAMR